MILVIFLIPMYISSLTFHETIYVTTHNLYSDIEIASPVYFCNRGTYNECPVARTNVGAMMKIGFRFDLGKLLCGILMYEVQKKGNTKSNRQYITDTTSTKTIEDTLKMTRLLVIWKIKSYERFKVHIALVEHGNEFVLNEDKLAELYDKVDSQLSRRCNTCAWLMNDNIVLEVTYEVVQKGDLELKITISKRAKNKYTKSALWTDSERQVLLLIVIYFC
jgi:hypothetical protein